MSDKIFEEDIDEVNPEEEEECEIDDSEKI